MQQQHHLKITPKYWPAELQPGWFLNFQNWVIADGWMPPLTAQSGSTAAQWQVGSKFCSKTLLNCWGGWRCLSSDLKASFNQEMWLWLDREVKVKSESAGITKGGQSEWWLRVSRKKVKTDKPVLLSTKDSLRDAAEQIWVVTSVLSCYIFSSIAM